MVLVLDAEARADLLQTGQHDVDGQGIQRHQRGSKRDEFPTGDRQAGLLACRGGRLVHLAIPIDAIQKGMRRLTAHST